MKYSNIELLEEMADYLNQNGYEDVAKDTRRLVEYIKSAKIRVETLFEIISPVFKAVEWYYSADWGKDRVDNGKWVVWNIFSGLYGVDIDKSTICQCTGLKDKNGKLIWENDVARCEVGIAEVIWDKSGWRTKWLKNDLWRKDLHYWAVENSEGAEVIGNIFDNPELLESERNNETD